MAISFEGDTLVFSGKRIAPSVRTLEQMLPALANPNADFGLPTSAPLYYMYRAAEKFGTIRYDITKILPADLGGECNKTFGHSHPKSPSGAAWPEAYEVLAGEAHFLLQRVSSLGVDDAVLLSGKKGDCLLIPPGYGHVTVNPGKKELLLANLVSGSFESDYSMFAQRRGACFYEMKGGKVVRNANYGVGFELRRETAVKFSSAFGCFSPFAKKSLLEAAKKPESLAFLEKPELFY